MSVSNKSKSFAEFIQICTALREQTTNCEKSQVKFSEAQSVTEAVAAFRMFWLSIVAQVPDKFIAVAAEHYADYRDEVNAAGVYFNEPPTDPSNALVFIGNSDEPITIDKGKPRVIVLGKANVTIADHVRCECHNAEAVIDCREFSRVKLIKGTAHVRDRSFAEGSGSFYTYGCSTTRIEGGELSDQGHLLIKSYNDAVIHSFTHRNIELNDNSQLINHNE